MKTTTTILLIVAVAAAIKAASRPIVQWAVITIKTSPADSRHNWHDKAFIDWRYMPHTYTCDSQALASACATVCVCVRCILPAYFGQYPKNAFFNQRIKKILLRRMLATTITTLAATKKHFCCSGNIGYMQQNCIWIFNLIEFIL